MSAIPPNQTALSSLPPGQGVGRVLGAVTISGTAPIGPMVVQGELQDGVLNTRQGAQIRLSDLPAGTKAEGKVSLFVPADGEGKALLFRPEVSTRNASVNVQAMQATLEKTLGEALSAKGQGTAGQVVADASGRAVSAPGVVFSSGTAQALTAPVPIVAKISGGELPKAFLPEGRQLAPGQPVSLQLSAPSPKVADTAAAVQSGRQPILAVQIAAIGSDGEVTLTGQNGLRMTAVVAANAASGQMPVLTVGQQVSLLPLAAAAQTAAPAALAQLARDWPLLTALLNPAPDSDVQPQASSATQATVPALNPLGGGPAVFARGLATLFQLAQSGHLSPTFAQRVIDLAQVQSPQLTEAIGKDAARLAFTARDGEGARWQGVSLPVLAAPRGDGMQVEMLHAFFRQVDLPGEAYDGGSAAQYSEDAPRKKRTGTRFLINIAFDAIGQIQFDGLASPGNLHLKLRHARPLPEDVLATAHHLYVSALEATGLTGQLTTHGETVALSVPEQDDASHGWAV